MESKQEALVAAFKKGLKEQYHRGLLDGTRAFTKVIYDKATDETKSVEERLQDVVQFAKVSLNIDDAARKACAAKEESEATAAKE